VRRNFPLNPDKRTYRHLYLVSNRGKFTGKKFENSLFFDGLLQVESLSGVMAEVSGGDRLSGQFRR